MNTTIIDLSELLPLTCTRTGTCCHGKQVWLNPWELFCLAAEKKVPPRDFRDLYTDFGGILLKFDGNPGWKQLPACSQYIPGRGCSVHPGRPLACRLYPLGRQIRQEEVKYIYQGEVFPCLEGCPEVVSLPRLNADTYLKEQLAETFEAAQDGYLQMMQQIADIAFMLFLDTGLAASGDTTTLDLWKLMGRASPQNLTNSIGRSWMEALILPDIKEISDPHLFIQKHMEQLEMKAQEEFGNIQNLEGLCQASGLMMGVALQLSRALGAEPESLADMWADTARNMAGS